MLIVDCIENIDCIFDYNFRDKSLRDFSSFKGEVIILLNNMTKQSYAMYSNGKFYLSIMEEIKIDKVKFKVFELNTFGSLIKTTDEELVWDKDGKVQEMMKKFKIAH